jgi:putative two-component system response regulator
MLDYADRILLVDDNADNVMILEELLAVDYTLMSATSGEEALRLAPAFRPSLILLDVMMPGLDGVNTCQSLRELPELTGSRIVMLSAKCTLPDRLAAYDVGAVDYIAKPFDHYEVTAKVGAWMRMVQKEKVDEIWRESEVACQAVGAAMLNLASFRDTETGDHLFRVRSYAQALGDELSRFGPYRKNVNAEFLQNLYLSTPLHDIGKVAIDDAILRKPGPLTKDEFERMKRHTVVGAELLKAAAHKLPQAMYLEMAADVARHHHERFDGSGYPDGLLGTHIPLAARILAVADAFDALTSKRVYKDAVSVAEAARIVVEEAGQHFDPVIVAAFQRRLADFHRTHARFGHTHAKHDGSIFPADALMAYGSIGDPCLEPGVGVLAP